MPEDTSEIYKMEVLDTPEVAILKRKIGNEINSYNLSPVIDEGVKRMVIIKEVPRKAIFEYAVSEGLTEPSLSFGKYQLWLHPSDFLAFLIESVEVKTKTIIIED